MVAARRARAVLVALVALTLEAAGAEDPGRDANRWYAMERGTSEALAQSIESWRVVRDRWAEAAFERLYAA